MSKNDFLRRPKLQQQGAWPRVTQPCQRDKELSHQPVPRGALWVAVFSSNRFEFILVLRQDYQHENKSRILYVFYAVLKSRKIKLLSGQNRSDSFLVAAGLQSRLKFHW